MGRFKRGDEAIKEAVDIVKAVRVSNNPNGKPPLPLTEEIIIDALRRAGGIVLRAAQLLSISSVTLYQRMKLNPEKYKEIREEISHTMYDLANEGIRQHLMVGNAKVCMFVKSRYEARNTMARFPEGDQSEYMDGGGNTFVQQNININHVEFHKTVNRLTEEADRLNVSPERVERIRQLQEELEMAGGE